MSLGIKLASPTFLYALALLVPILIAFLVRKNRTVLKVPSTMVWRLGARSVRKSRRFKDLRRWLALAACLVAVGALAFASARPTGKASGTRVFVVDASSSMAGAPIDGARRWLVREVSTLGADARVAIVRAGSEPKVLLAPSPPGPRVDEAINALSADRDSAALEQAVALAEGLAGKYGEVVILTDSPVDDRVSRRESKATVRVFPRGKAGSTPDNVGISGLFTRTPPEVRDETERDCTVSVATSSAAPRQVRLTVTLGKTTVADRKLEIPPHGDVTEHVAIRGGGRLVARVTPADGKSDAIAVDDEASLEETARQAPRVLLVRPEPADPAEPAADEPPRRRGHPAREVREVRGQDERSAEIAAYFVAKALRAGGVKDITELVPEAAPPPKGSVDVAIVLADGTARPRDIPTFWIGPNPEEISHFRMLTREELHLRSVANEDPLMRGVSLDGVTILRATIPTPPPRGSRALVELDPGPVLLAGGAANHAWVWLGIDPAASDLVLRVAFPVLVTNVIAELAGGSQVVAAKTAPRSEVTLATPEVETALAPPSEPRWRIPTSPSMLLAGIGAFLLVLEAWLTFRRKWAL